MNSEADRELRDQIDKSKAFLRRALRFWSSVPLMLAAGAVACAVFFFIRKPMYRSETVVLYSQPAATSGESSEPMGGARNVTLRMKELLMSRPKLERVVGEFGLYPDVRSEIGMGEAVEELKQHIEYRAPGGDTFSIAFLGRSPEQVQGVTKRLAALVIEQDSELRRNQAQVTRDFLTAEKGKTEVVLRSAERELAGFMAKYPRFALDVTPLATGAAIRATTPGVVPGAQHAPTRMTVLVPRAASSAGVTPKVGDAPRPMIATTVDVDSEIARANAAVAAARANLAEQLERYTPAHPDVRAAAAAVERAESRLSTLAAAAPVKAPSEAPAPSSTESFAQAPAPRAASASAPVVPPAADPATSSRDVVALETEWLKLTRAATEARQRYDQVSAALFKADIVASSESGGRGVQMTVIDPAYLPTRPLPPGRGLIAAIFLGVAFMLGAALALIRAVLDDRIFEAPDVRSPVPLLVAIPRPGSTRSVHVPS